MKTPVNEGFVIPRPRSHLGVSGREARRTDIGPFRLRGIVHHRVIPNRIGGYEVRLCGAETSFNKLLSEVAYGAGFLGGLDFTVQDTADEFWVTAVTGFEYGESVNRHLEAAHREECSVLVYPELTIDSACREQIKKSLVARLWRRSNPSLNWTIPAVVAGSWHEPVEGSLVNVATVYDGYGKQIAEHRKMFPYTDPEGRAEKILRGETLTVIVFEDALVALGICRDFSERGIPNPFAELDVDLFLITSLANEATMRGHLVTCSP